MASLYRCRRTLSARMQALEDAEQLAGVARVESRAVVGNAEGDFAVPQAAADVQSRSGRAEQ